MKTIMLFNNQMKNKAKKGVVPRKKMMKNMKSRTFVLFFFTLLMSLKGQSQEIAIEAGDSPYYCNSTITLIAPHDATHTYSWTASGSVALKEVGETGNGSGILNVTGSNKVDLVITGRGKVKVKCESCVNPSPSDYTYELPIAPSIRPLDISVKHGGLKHPNGIQTEHSWICLGAKSTDEYQEVTVRSPARFNIFWSISGGAERVPNSGEVEFQDGEYVATVKIKTDGTKRKGFIRAAISDSCGNTVCGGGGSGIDWEILKNIVPDDIYGVTCLRDNNLDNTKSTVYSIPDEIAGNAIFKWELYDENGAEVEEEDPRFNIKSTVVYGNSATITYKGNHTPTSVGNFTVVATNNECEASFGEAFYEKEITVSPEAPSTLKETYCAPATIGEESEEIKIDNPKDGLVYTWAVLGDADWNIQETEDDGKAIKITFNDIVNGVVVVKATTKVSDDDDDIQPCASDNTLIYINRTGGDVSVTGVNCIQRGTNEAFSFTASPFGLFEWDVTPALPTSWTLSSIGNILTVTPPTSGIDITGNYTVTASLQGCDDNNTDSASFDFEIGPDIPTISDKSCVVSGTNYDYTIVSEGATSADVTITSGGVIASTQSIELPGAFNFTAINEDFTVGVVTYSASGCASLLETLDVKVKPTAIINRGPQACGDNPEVTFTANTTGMVTDYQWNYPTSWYKTDGGGSDDNTITLKLNDVSGDITLTPINDGCAGDMTTLNVIANPLNIKLRQGTVNGLPSLIAISETPLIMEFRFSTSELTNCTSGNEWGSTEEPITFGSIPHINGMSNWVSVKVTDPNTRCDDCYKVKVATLPPLEQDMRGRFESNNKTKKGAIGLKANFDIKAFPNPTSTVLNVEVPTSEKTEGMMLVDSQGKVVFRKRSANNKEQINVSNYSKGLYFLYVQTAKRGFAMKKIIIE